MLKKIVASILIPFTANGSWPETTLDNLSLREKIGQLFMVATSANSSIMDEADATQITNSAYKMSHAYVEQLISDYHIGGLIFLYKGYPEDQLRLTNYFQQISKLPLLLGQDCEWGLAMRLYNTVQFPRNMSLAATGNPDLIYSIGYEIGQQCKAMGIHINFAPVVDINTNQRNPVIGSRSFGDTKELVAEYGALFVKGLQDAGTLACAKHFPGHGDTFQDSHLELAKVLRTHEEIQDEELYPFKHLIDQGVACIMNAHLHIPALDKTHNMPTSLSKKVVTNLLQKNMNFKGLVITDGMGMKAITQHYKPGEAALKALLAGNDIILCPVDVPQAVETIEQAVLKGNTLTEKELDQHVLKVLQAKEKLQLHKSRTVDQQKALARIDNPYAQLLKKEAYENAITLVNQKKFTPLPLEESTALVQVGGSMPNRLEIALKNHTAIDVYHLSALPEKEQILFVENKLTEKETVIITMFDIKPNAIKYGIDDNIVTCIKALQKQGKKIIICLFGTPYALGIFDTQIPVLVAYENDADAQQAVAEIILGKKKANGRLPISLA